jgi:hypothetical protein
MWNFYGKELKLMYSNLALVCVILSNRQGANS